MPHSLWTLTIAAAFGLLTSCASAPRAFVPGEPCVAPAFSVLGGFAGARRGRCTVLADNHVRLDIHPEDDGRMNDSPWYAFQIVPAAAGITASVSLRYHGGHHRYLPKISSDGVSWTPLGEEYVISSI